MIETWEYLAREAFARQGAKYGVYLREFLRYGEIHREKLFNKRLVD